MKLPKNILLLLAGLMLLAGCNTVPSEEMNTETGIETQQDQTQEVDWQTMEEEQYQDDMEAEQMESEDEIMMEQ